MTRASIGLAMCCLVAAGACGSGRHDGADGSRVDAGGADAALLGADAGDDGAPPDAADADAAAAADGAADGSLDAARQPEAQAGAPVVLRTASAQKVDLLFMIDNSASMGDKQALLAQAIPDMIARLVSPNCVATDGTVVGQSGVDGQCATGTVEFPPVHDMHIGIVTSSLGGRGGNECSPADLNPANMALNAHEDDRGELVNRGGDSEAPVANAMPSNFLAWFPGVAQNAGLPAPPVPAETAVGAPGQAGTLVGDFTAMISGVHEHGCGFEAQNEAWYRFLVQPDPFDHIAITADQASLVGIDSVILQQRAAFLRPDSLVAVIVVTDENEEVANPLSVGSQGWLYETFPWPSSPTGGGAPEGTIECSTAGPDDPGCTSCGYASVMASASFATRCPADPPSTVPGYLDVSDDQVNVRFFDQKRRFGVFAGYPITRYVRGLTQPTVPDAAHEVDANGNYVGDGDANANCVNPLFAQDLPTSPTADLCHLTRGPRTPDLVYYAAIAGVPHELLQAKPGDPECPATTPAADCPQKTTLTAPDWQAITGADPEHYDFTGLDFHMLESEGARAASACPPDAGDDCDPVNGREWNTGKSDLQFACVFPLQAPKDCTLPQYAFACDCAAGSNSQDTPLCQKDGGVYTNLQIKGKAYPSIREMRIAHAMAAQPWGVQGVVSSLCPIHPTPSGPNDPISGYRPALNGIVNRLKSAFTIGCLGQSLAGGSAGAAQCRVFVTLTSASSVAAGESACAALPGLSAPAPDVLQSFQQAQHEEWTAAGGSNSGQPDPSTMPSCLMQQLTPAANPADFQNGSCQGSTDPGWCYVTEQSSTTCSRQVVFSQNEPPSGNGNVILSLFCGG